MGSPAAPPAPPRPSPGRALLAALAAAEGGPAAARPRALLEALLEFFAATCPGAPQRSPGWYAAMAVTVGGSEVAAILGLSPYANFYSVVAAKAALLAGTAVPFQGGLACSWGVLFEDVIGAVVEADLGTRVIGDSICVQALPGHRNSPDGYAVVRVYPGEGGGLHVWRTAQGGVPPAGQDVAVLLEFKCPLSRRPTGGVPRHYRPQLWSGLAVSPLAAFGLFVDAVFRKCALAELGLSAAYDLAFHDRARGRRPYATAPIAWGVITFFSPSCAAAPGAGAEGAALGAGGAETDAADAERVGAARVAARLRRLGGVSEGGAVDLGALDEGPFAHCLGFVDRGLFTVARGPPCFADGRGALAADLVATAAAAPPPPGFELFGLLPWKLFELAYVPVERHADFAGEVLPRIAEVHALAAAAAASARPGAFLAAHARRAAGEPDDEEAPEVEGPGAEDLAALYATLAGEP